MRRSGRQSEELRINASACEGTTDRAYDRSRLVAVAPAGAAPLEFRNVTKRYAGTKAAAIENLSFTVPAGEVCVLVGPSGCGKTTAMRLVNRMIEPSGGDILIGDHSVLGRSEVELRR